jgi:hypothetical protein
MIDRRRVCAASARKCGEARVRSGRGVPGQGVRDQGESGQGESGQRESGQGESGNGAADPCSDSLRDVTCLQVADA